jgi:uncharacterized protein YlxW (UPF0749 family)
VGQGTGRSEIINNLKNYELRVNDIMRFSGESAFYAFSATVYVVSIAYAIKRRAQLRKAAAARAIEDAEYQKAVDALEEDSKQKRHIIKELEERVVETRHQNVLARIDQLADTVEQLTDTIEQLRGKIDQLTLRLM